MKIITKTKAPTISLQPKCGGHYDNYPDNCEMCSRYMDDCDGAQTEEEDE